MDRISEEMEKSFRKLVIDLIPRDDYIEYGTRLVEKMKTLLLQKSRFRIDRGIYAGSIGKHTEVMSPDFDVVLFVNDQQPPFDEVKDDWEDILLMNDEFLKIDPNSIKQTPISVQFKMGFIEVDLLPAVNLVPPNQRPNLDGRKLAEVQLQQATGITEENANMFSSTLSESQIYFMKDQSEFTHQVVRLAKFWYKTLYLGPAPIYGVKTMLELIAVSAAMQEQATYDSPCLIRTFNRFLNDVERIDKLRLGFKKNHKGLWELTQTEGCAIIEPANPYNDLSKNFAEREVELGNLKKFAMITRERISEAVQLNHCSGLHFFNIFRPLPKKLCERFRVDSPHILGCSELDTSYKSLVPDMLINNPKRFNQKGPGPVMEDILKVIQLNLYTAVSSAVSSVAVPGEDPEETVKKVTPMIERMLSEDLWGQKYSPWKPTTLRHEDYDVTFKIPISTERKQGAVTYSFKWD